MAEKVVFFGHFSSTENATATRLLGVHPYNFLSTCREVCDNLSRSQIGINVANAFRGIFLEVEKSLFLTFLRLNRERHRFSSPDRLHSIPHVILHRKGYVRIGNKESAKLNSKLQKKYKWYIKPDLCIRKPIKFYVGYIRSGSQFHAFR